jgi:hypothetical protein
MLSFIGAMSVCPSPKMMQYLASLFFINDKTTQVHTLLDRILAHYCNTLGYELYETVDDPTTSVLVANIKALLEVGAEVSDQWIYSESRFPMVPHRRFLQILLGSQDRTEQAEEWKPSNKDRSVNVKIVKCTEDITLVGYKGRDTLFVYRQQTAPYTLARTHQEIQAENKVIKDNYDTSVLVANSLFNGKVLGSEEDSVLASALRDGEIAKYLDVPSIGRLLSLQRPLARRLRLDGSLANESPSYQQLQAIRDEVAKATTASLMSPSNP